MSDKVPTKYSTKILKIKKRGAAKIAKRLGEQVRPSLDSGKFISRKVKFLMDKEGLTQKQALGKAFGIARDLGFNVPDK